MTSSLQGVLIASMVILVLSAHVAAAQQRNWPSLRFHFTLKRSSMKVHGDSDFSMYANPVLSDNNDNVLYDAFASFKDNTNLYNYTLIDGAAYASTTSFSGSSFEKSNVVCVDSESGTLPAINSIVTAINEATAISSVSGSGSDAIKCSSGHLFKVTIKSIDFALCASSSSGFTMHGTDMDIDVKFLERSFDIQMPVMDSKSQCTKVVSPTSVTSIGKLLLTGQDKSVCTCQSTPRPCIFIHGLGVKTETSYNEDWFSYWGDAIKGHTPCCSSVKYAHLDTVNNTWTSKTLQNKVCNRALAVSSTSTKSVISDTIVVTHSMGNLMFAGALATGKCSLDSSSTWVGMAGPMIGSMASDFVQESCSGETNIMWEEIGDITGRCPPNTGLKSLAYENGNHSTPSMNKEYEAAQMAYRENVAALMCGRSYSGLVSKYQAKFWALGHSIPHKSKENDGMVEFQSCAHGFPESKFGDNYRDRFYKTKLNHYDMQFLAGDSVMNEDKMPVKWFECLL